MQPNPATNIVSPITIPDPVPRVTIVPTNTFAKIVQGSIPEPHVSNVKQNKIIQTPDPSTVTMSRNPSLKPNENNAIITPIKADQLAKYLQGYDASLYNFLIQVLNLALKFLFKAYGNFVYLKTFHF